MQHTKVQFTNTVNGLSYIIGEKEFNSGETKEDIYNFINKVIEVYESTIQGYVSYVIMININGIWQIPINKDTLHNEL